MYSIRQSIRDYIKQGGDDVQCAQCKHWHPNVVDPPTLRDRTCGNCDDHVSKCFDEELRRRLSKWATEGKVMDADLAKYFEPVLLGPGDDLVRGDVIIWDTKSLGVGSHHTSVATGVDRIVSQYGYSVEHWKLLRKHQQNPGGMTDAEKKKFHSPGFEQGGHQELKLDELDQAIGLAPPKVYRLKPEYADLRICEHLQKNPPFLPRQRHCGENNECVRYCCDEAKALEDLYEELGIGGASRLLSMLEQLWNELRESCKHTCNLDIGESPAQRSLRNRP